MGLTIAVVGATGLVGRTMLRVLEERGFAHDKLVLLASQRSAGSLITAFGKEHVVHELREDSFEGVDIALFSAGGVSSLAFAPHAAKAGCIVIDNSSAWRMHPKVPLVVPEVNADALAEHHGIIANPNCSTIQMVVALKPLQDAFGLKRVVVSTYQSVSGAGQKGVEHLMAELQERNPLQRISPHKVAFNAVFHSIAEDEGFSEEEIKMKQETRRIMSLPNLNLAVTCVRVPVLGGHGESINIECERPFTIAELRSALERAPGIVVLDDARNALYPTPQYADGRDEVFVGRLRVDDSASHAAHLWVVADNLRKGAATNAVQIAETLVRDARLDFEAAEFAILRA